MQIECDIGFFSRLFLKLNLTTEVYTHPTSTYPEIFSVLDLLFEIDFFSGTTSSSKTDSLQHNVEFETNPSFLVLS